MDLKMHHHIKNAQHILWLWIWCNLAYVKKRKLKDECAFNWSSNISLDHDIVGWGANIVHSLVLVLEVETFMNDKLDFFYKSLYQSDEAIVFVWSTEHGVGRYRWLCNLIIQVPTICLYYLSHPRILIDWMK